MKTTFKYLPPASDEETFEISPSKRIEYITNGLLGQKFLPRKGEIEKFMEENPDETISPAYRLYQCLNDRLDKRYYPSDEEVKSIDLGDFNYWGDDFCNIIFVYKELKKKSADYLFHQDAAYLRNRIFWMIEDGDLFLNFDDFDSIPDYQDVDWDNEEEFDKAITKTEQIVFAYLDKVEKYFQINKIEFLMK